MLGRKTDRTIKSKNMFGDDITLRVYVVTHRLGDWNQVGLSLVDDENAIPYGVITSTIMQLQWPRFLVSASIEIVEQLQDAGVLEISNITIYDKNKQPHYLCDFILTETAFI